MPQPTQAYVPGPDPLSDTEWAELNTLRNAIKDQPSSVHPAKMERFTELFVRTLPKE